MNDIAILNPVVLADIKPDFDDLVAQHNPNATKPFLRYQFGRKIQRQMDEPIFEGKMLTGHFKSPTKVTVFRLMGFGVTAEAALAMARRAK